MDESWRMKMGMPKLPTYPSRRSTEDVHRKPISDNDSLNPEDFVDVFGGPPRTVLSRQFSTGSYPRSPASSNFLYEEIFQAATAKGPQGVRRSGRSLPEFRIPGESRRKGDDRRNRGSNSFYSDVFRWDDERVVRSRSRSKTSSSSVLSSEEQSPIRAVGSHGGEDNVSSFASKLRPINVKSKWNSTRMGNEDQQKQHKGKQPMYNNTESEAIENLRNYPFGFSRRNTSPEAISIEPISNRSFFGVSADDLGVNSPSSPVSSICHSEQEDAHGVEHHEIEEDEEDEVMSSYVIEINSDYKEGTPESNGVDEAIAWAKEKFNSYCSESSSKPAEEIFDSQHLSEGLIDSFRSVEECAMEEENSKIDALSIVSEAQILDEKIRLWSNGKGADIRLLLSSLHHILWHNSGWHAIPLINIIESSKVKKAYQKAQLCLHPDKLQQRGATAPQKYIAERAFSVLQDAWAAFLSQDH